MKEFEKDPYSKSRKGSGLVDYAKPGGSDDINIRIVEGDHVQDRVGLKWQPVGDTQPTEGRLLTNSKLADALASKTSEAEEQQSKSVSFTDTEGGISTLKLDDETRFLSWHAQGQCFLERIRVLEFLPSGVIRAPEHSLLTARHVDPAPGPARDRLLRDIASMSLSAGGVQLVGFFDFTKEDLDKFGITDLRSTDFIKAGGSYFKPIGNKKGVVVQDCFTKNPEDPEPYKVKWENGEVSGWLKPEDIVCVRDKESPWIQECTKNGQISQVVSFQEGSYITGNVSCLNEPVSEENLQEEKKNESGPKEPEGDVRSLVCG